jgi:hypothetical protein
MSRLPFAGLPRAACTQWKPDWALSAFEYLQVLPPVGKQRLPVNVQ